MVNAFLDRAQFHAFGFVGGRREKGAILGEFKNGRDCLTPAMICI